MNLHKTDDVLQWNSVWYLFPYNVWIFFHDKMLWISWLCHNLIMVEKRKKKVRELFTFDSLMVCWIYYWMIMNYYTPTCAHGPPLDTTATFWYTPNGVLDGGNGNSGSGILWSTTYLVYTNLSYSHNPNAAAITVPMVNSPPTIRHIFVLKKKKHSSIILFLLFWIRTSVTVWTLVLRRLYLHVRRYDHCL